jgi:ribonuclease D
VIASTTELSLLTRGAEVQELALRLAAAGRFALDLEFLSANRYIPEIALVQVAWGDPAAPEAAAVDPLEADLAPLLALVAAPEVETILHAGQGDLALLADRFGTAAAGVLDSQIGAVFAGLGESVGYARLVGELLGVEVDKELQFTNWLERPLSERKLRYALDDVRYLLPAWSCLEQQLDAAGRLGWVREDSARLAAGAAVRLPPAEAYRKTGSWQRLNGPQLGALAALAEWRERTALESNKPPSWVLKENTLVTLARRLPRRLAEVLAAGAPAERKQLDRLAPLLLELVAQGREQPIQPPARSPLGAQLLSAKAELEERLAEASRRLELPAHRLAPKGEIEELVRRWAAGDPESEPRLGLLTGWRREALGQELLDRLGPPTPRLAF